MCESIVYGINVGEERGLWTPYPLGFNPPTPAQIFAPYLCPLFSLFFWGVPLPKIPIFSPRPADPCPPRPFLVKSPPTPDPLTPEPPTPLSSSTLT